MALSAARETFCAQRATGASIKEAAAKAGISERSGQYWDDDPAMLARIDALQAPIRDAVLRIFKGKAERAARRMTECLEPGYNLAGAAVNLRAAELVLKHAGFGPVEVKDVTLRGGVKMFTDELMNEV